MPLCTMPTSMRNFTCIRQNKQYTKIDIKKTTILVARFKKQQCHMYLKGFFSKEDISHAWGKMTPILAQSDCCHKKGSDVTKRFKNSRLRIYLYLSKVSLPLEIITCKTAFEALVVTERLQIILAAHWMTCKP